MYASLEGHMDIIKYLIEEKQADITIKNREHQTAIEVAEDNANLEIVEYLKNL